MFLNKKEYLASIGSILDSGNQDAKNIEADLLTAAKILRKNLVFNNR